MANLTDKFTVTDNMQRTFTIRLLSYDLKWKPQSRNLKIVFYAVGLDYAGEYEYNWNSSSQMGLASLYKRGNVLYDPYRKNNPSEGVTMIEIGREVSQYIDNIK